MTVTTMLLLFAVLMALGMPIGFAMSLSAATVLLLFETVPLVLLPQLFYTSIDNFSLLAIPLFVFAGALMSIGGITDQIVTLARAMIGHRRGGLAQANVVSNTFMAAVSGSAAADVAAVSSIMIPAMSKAGYPKPFAVAVTSSAAMLAPVLPPSIIAVIYASVMGLSVGKLFLAGVIPGILCALAIMALTWHYAWRNNMPLDARVDWSARWQAFLKAAPALGMPALIIGGIVTGIFTATEAGAIACVYAMIYCSMQKKICGQRLFDALIESALIAGTALVVLAGAALFSWVLIRSGASAGLIDAIMGLSSEPGVIVAVILFVLFLIGIFMEPVPALVLTAPLLSTATSTLGLDPMSFGIAVIMMLIVGSVTPPVGVLAMIACRIARIPYASTFKAIIPFTVLWLVIIAVIVAVPTLSNFLPNLLTE